MSTLISQPQAKPSLRMTEEEFVAWAGNDTAAEWVDGEVFLKMPDNEEQDEIQRLIATIIETIVRRRRLGKVRGSHFTTRMRIDDRSIRRDPDVMFIATANPAPLTPTLLDGPADLVVEVVSPDSENRDFRDKYYEYEKAGVREYWIASPMSQQLYQFVRSDKTGLFERRDPDAEKKFRSAVIDGLWFRESDLFAKERPDVITLMKEMGVE
jgi:Uma2 family endonuclease